MAPQIPALVVDQISLPGLAGTSSPGEGVLHLTFGNGLLISVIRHEGSYGNKQGEGLFEVGYWFETGQGKRWPEEPVGWLTQAQAVARVLEVSAAHGPSAEAIAHVITQEA